MLLPSLSVLLPAILHASLASARWAAVGNPERFPVLEDVPDSGPLRPADYMMDHTHNLFGTAPDKGKQHGFDWGSFETLENYLASLDTLHSGNESSSAPSEIQRDETIRVRQDGGFWLTELGPLGKAPLVEGDYKFWRNVMDYGATGNGEDDDTMAINAAVADGDRCGEECGNTFAQGAIIYFPPGTYKVCTPIIQLYYTQFVGHPTNRPVIKGCDTFTGIGLIDTNVYIEGGSGMQWYINQNQFFRHIRNFEFDLRDMPVRTDDAGQGLVPTGIHWQVSQATTLQNLKFIMPTGEDVTHVGIFTENGSGGFVSDLEFEGGNIGWRVGSQQYTARNLRFTGCTTAVQMIWDWGFNWQQVDINSCAIGFNLTGKGGDANHEAQGVGSISLIDSAINNTAIGILTREDGGDPPNIVIDNLQASNVDTIVQSQEGSTLLQGGTTRVDLWAAGQRYNASTGSYEVGHVQGAPPKPNGLLSGGKLFVRSRPQYENLGADSFLVATEYGLSNDATGDQTELMNEFLREAQAAGKVAYFPAGIYMVHGTVFVPPGSRLQGSSWSQIMATGDYFGDMEDPKVVVRVGNKGDVGSMEIVEMMITAKGPTAGAIMMEWNIQADSQGSAAMWDSHIRIGGMLGSDLDFANCPKGSFEEKCICAAMLLHVTSEASGYFENVWAWIADHDNDKTLYRVADSSSTQISIFGARGMLIESQEPSWFYGTGSEHAVLYQYQLVKAKNVYMGHIQTEAPYFQPVPPAPEPFQDVLGQFPEDPSFEDCEMVGCKMGWGLRIIDSSDVYFHSMGMYSWFQDYRQYCVDGEDCQDQIMQLKGEIDNVAMYNIFTKASIEVGSGGDNNTIFREDVQSGFTTEVSVWFPGDGIGENIVYIGREVYDEPTAQCEAPCILVLPPSSLSSETTISPSPYTTSLQVGGSTTTITVTPKEIVTDEIPMSNVDITRGEQSTFLARPSIDQEPVPVAVVPSPGVTTTRMVTPAPWPPSAGGAGSGDAGSGDAITDIPGLEGAGTGTGDGEAFPFPTATSMPAPPAENTFHIIRDCPADGVLTEVDFQATITLGDCTGQVTFGVCEPTETVAMDAPSGLAIPISCTMYTGTRTADGSAPTSPAYEITPVLEDEDEEDEDDDEDDDPVVFYVPCDAWFFSICLQWPDLKIKGIKIKAPRGTVIGPGPPPFVRPPGITIRGNLPTWPPITIPARGPVPTPDKPTDCETESAEACMTTTSFDQVVTEDAGRTVTTTTATHLAEDCQTIYGCKVSDWESQTTTVSECRATPAVRARQGGNPPAPAPAFGASCRRQYRDAIIYPRDPEDAQDIMDWLDRTPNPDSPGQTWGASTVRVWAPAADFTAFFFVKQFGEEFVRELSIPEVQDELKIAEAGFLQDLNFNTLLNDWNFNSGTTTFRTLNTTDRTTSRQGEIPQRKRAGPDKPSPTKQGPKGGIRKRATTFQSSTNIWELAFMSCPNDPARFFEDDPTFQIDPSGQIVSNYFYDDSAGQGQVVYVIESGGNPDHPEYGTVQVLEDQYDFGPVQNAQYTTQDHGVATVSKIRGVNAGSAKQATVILSVYKDTVPTPDPDSIHDPDEYGRMHALPQRVLVAWLNILNDIVANGHQGRAVISVSVGNSPYDDPNSMTALAWESIYRRLVQKLNSLDVLVVASVHNDFDNRGDDPDRIHVPAVWGDPSSFFFEENVLSVSSVDMDSRVAPFAPSRDWMVYAPGVAVSGAVPGQAGYVTSLSGSSYATPLVAGIAAYFRALPSSIQDDLRSPRKLKALIKLLQTSHRYRGSGHADANYPTPNTKPQVPTVWNGQVYGESCLLNPGLSLCPDIQRINTEADLDKAPLPAWAPAAGGGGSVISFVPGAPSPTCSADCGVRCEGFYCGAEPTGEPPDFFDDAVKEEGRAGDDAVKEEGRVGDDDAVKEEGRVGDDDAVKEEGRVGDDDAVKEEGRVGDDDVKEEGRTGDPDDVKEEGRPGDDDAVKEEGRPGDDDAVKEEGRPGVLPRHGRVSRVTYSGIRV